jgi:hypothetical protein
MYIVLQKQTFSIFRDPPEDATSKILWNTATQDMLSNLDHMFIHQRENLKGRTPWKVHAGKIEWISTTLYS